MSYKVELNIFWLAVSVAWVLMILTVNNDISLAINCIGLVHALASGTTIHKQ